MFKWKDDVTAEEISPVSYGSYEEKKSKKSYTGVTGKSHFKKCWLLGEDILYHGAENISNNKIKPSVK